MAGFYTSRRWAKARAQAMFDHGWLCTSCGASLIGKGRGAHVHHRKPLKRARALALEPQNLRPICAACHNKREPRDMIAAERARPSLPRPRCRVRLVCGPVAVGKTTYVEANKQPGDIVIDLDLIAGEWGYARHDAKPVAKLLEERNHRLSALAHAPINKTAWVTLTAPTKVLRDWWCDTLGVVPGDMTLLLAERTELYRRIDTDPARQHCKQEHRALVDDWFAQEQANVVRVIIPGCSIDGEPLDPAHPWNLAKEGGGSKIETTANRRTGADPERAISRIRGSGGF